MRRALIAAAAALIAMPAAAQTWDTIPLAPPAITGLPNGIPASQQNVSGINTRSGGDIIPLSYNNAGFYWGSTGFYPFNTIPTAAVSSNSQVGVRIDGIYYDPSAPGGVSGLSGYVPLTAFATAASTAAYGSRLNALDGQVAGLSARIDGFIAGQQAAVAEARRSQEHLTRGIALASSLSLLSPAAGRENRLGFGLGSFGGETAMSINYTRRAGDFDFGLAGALSGGEGLGKASLGVSW